MDPPLNAICSGFALFFQVQLVWVLYIDMMCLDYDGNLTDACLTAMMAALYNSKYTSWNSLGSVGNKLVPVYTTCIYRI